MTYVTEHKSEVWRFLKHLGPWVAGFWAILISIIAGAIASGWVDLPVRAQTVAAIEKTVKLNTKNLSLLTAKQQELVTENALNSQQLTNIEKKVGGVDDKLDKILGYLLRSASPAPPY